MERGELLSLLLACLTFFLGYLQLRERWAKTKSESAKMASESKSDEANAANKIVDTAVNILLQPLEEKIRTLQERVEKLERIERAYRYLREEALKNDMPVAVGIADEIAAGAK